LYRQKGVYAKTHGVQGLDKKYKINVFDTDPETVRRYSALHGQMRSIATRSVMGSIVMGTFVLNALAKGKDDDDEEENSYIKNLLATKAGRRFLQKHLPLGLSMLAPYMYGDDDAEILPVLEMFNTYTGGDFDKFDNLRMALKKAKNDEAEKRDVWAKFIGGFLPTYNVNQPEQVVKFWHTLQSGLDKNQTSAVEWDQEVSKDIYTQAEGIWENMTINGLIEAISRGFDNRYIENK
jgi:hypothetical protein